MTAGNWPNLSDAFFVSSRNSLLDRLLAEPSLRMCLVAAAVLAHFGLRLTFYNRLNSMGWKRATIKRTEKIAFVETWVTPCVMGWLYGSDVWDWIHGDVTVISLPAWVIAYAIACSVLGLVFGSLWLLWRPIFRVHHVHVVREIQVHDLVNRAGRSLARTRKCRWAAKLPFNQIFQMSVEQIELPVVGLPDELDGYKVAHLSDIHLTGQVEPEFTQHAISAANEWRPDLFALTGDIVDKQPCVAWLHDLFSKASASDGCYFVLGNHDTRISDPDVVRERMKGAGWIDVGGLVHSTRLRSVSCALSGNEYPWFSRPSEQAMRGADAEFRFCLSHSPDQFDWCRRNEVDLMLAGHTHGGQGRLPIAGPILSPSWHGSRWASGDFYRAPTTLHVSRGLSGVHLLRINCRPELSLITLRCSHA